MRLPILFAFAAVSAASLAEFQVIVTETPTGSVGQQSWMGVRKYTVFGTHGPMTLGNGIDKALVSDPSNVQFDSFGELFVANRHGNTQASSISRFTYDFSTDSFVPNGTITGNGLFGVHASRFSPSGELFGANVQGGVSRFTRAGQVFSPNGILGSGTTRECIISSSGSYAYVTTASNILKKYAVSNGALLQTYSVPGASSIHTCTWHNGDLYASDFGSGAVFKLMLDGNGDIVSSSLAASAAAAIGCAFSPDGDEMFVASHTGNAVFRFKSVAGTWVGDGAVQAGVNLGGITVMESQGQTVVPTSFNINLGRNSNNATAAALATGGDNDQLTVCQFILPNNSLPYCRMTVTAANTGLTTLSKARLDLRCNSQTSGAFKMVVNAKLNGGSGATRDSLTVNNFPTVAMDYVVPMTAGAGSLNDYLGANGQLGCQIEIHKTGPSASFLPCTLFDKVVWKVIP